MLVSLWFPWEATDISGFFLVSCAHVRKFLAAQKTKAFFRCLFIAAYLQGFSVSVGPTGLLTCLSVRITVLFGTSILEWKLLWSRRDCCSSLTPKWTIHISRATKRYKHPQIFQLYKKNSKTHTVQESDQSTLCKPVKQKKLTRNTM